MADVKWLRFKVGMFDGDSFKRIKRAKIDGVVDFRDKLTAVWFELIDLAGKVNNNGYYFNDEVAYASYEDFSIMLDRTEKEIEMCIGWFVKNGMIEQIDNHFLLSNFTKYQNSDGLEKIRLQNRERVRKHRENKKLLELENGNVTVTLCNEIPLKDNNTLISLSNSLSNIEDLKESKSKKFKKPTVVEIQTYCDDRNNGINATTFYDFYESKGWLIGKNPMKDWKAAVRTWE